MSTVPSEFTLGIEEEYLLVDKDSLDLAPVPEGLMEACQLELESQVAPECLNCQIEITYRCNHLCTFCYNSPTGKREMTTEQIFEALARF